METKLERRCLASAELRASGEMKLVGYAAVFNSLSQDLGGFRERIRLGTFARSITNGADVRGLFNHDPNQVLGRTTAGTLELSEDNHGLKSVIHLPDTTLGRDLYESVKRHDINSMSFGFVARQDEWSSDRTIRTLLDVDLFDVSPVTFPAYPQTQVSARSLGWYLGEQVRIPGSTEVDERERLVLQLRLAHMITKR